MKILNRDSYRKLIEELATAADAAGVGAVDQHWVVKRIAGDRPGRVDWHLMALTTEAFGSRATPKWAINVANDVNQYRGEAE